MIEYIIAFVVGCIIGCVLMFFGLRGAPSAKEKEKEAPAPVIINPTYDQMKQISSYMDSKGYTAMCRSKCDPPLKKCPKGCTCCAQADFDKQAKQIEDEINATIFNIAPPPKPKEEEKKTAAGNPITSALGTASKTLTAQLPTLPNLPSIV